MNVVIIDKYLLDNGFIISDSYKGNVHFCRIYRNEKVKVHVWFDDDGNTIITYKDVGYLQREFDIIGEIREYKLNKLIRKEDSSL